MLQALASSVPIAHDDRSVLCGISKRPERRCVDIVPLFHPIRDGRGAAVFALTRSSTSTSSTQGSRGVDGLCTCRRAGVHSENMFLRFGARWQTVSVADGDGFGGSLDTLSVLFTDVVGSTALRGELGEDVAEVVRRAHDGLVTEIVEGHGGRIVKGMGDGFLATFGSAARAVAAAAGIQQGIYAQRFVEP